jgi:hypothetical protein
MKLTTKHGKLWLAPALLAATTLLACSDDRTIAAQTTTTPTCGDLGSSDFVPGSRHMPRC